MCVCACVVSSTTYQRVNDSAMKLALVSPQNQKEQKDCKALTSNESKIAYPSEQDEHLGV